MEIVTWKQFKTGEIHDTVSVGREWDVYGELLHSAEYLINIHSTGIDHFGSWSALLINSIGCLCWLFLLLSPLVVVPHACQ